MAEGATTSTAYLTGRGIQTQCGGSRRSAGKWLLNLSELEAEPKWELEPEPNLLTQKASWCSPSTWNVKVPSPASENQAGLVQLLTSLLPCCPTQGMSLTFSAPMSSPEKCMLGLTCSRCLIKAMPCCFIYTPSFHSSLQAGVWGSQQHKCLKDLPLVDKQLLVAHFSVGIFTFTGVHREFTT